MDRAAVFTDSGIADFCRVTGDTNPIHDPAAMAARGKLAIVPGMYTFLSAVALAGDELRQSRRATAYFGSPVIAGEELLFRAAPGDEPLEVRLSAYRREADGQETDVLRSRQGSYSSIRKNTSGALLPLDVQRRTVSFDRHEVARFGQLIGSNGDDITGFLFAVALSSYALFQSVQSPNPENETEASLSRRIASSQVLPVYESLDIHLYRQFHGIDASRPLDFATSAETHGRRDVTFYVMCSQRARGAKSSQSVYNAIYHLVLVPEQIVFQRVARNIAGQ